MSEGQSNGISYDKIFPLMETESLIFIFTANLMAEGSAVARVNLHPDYGRQAFVHQEHHSRIRGNPDGGDDRLLTVLLRYH